MPTSDDRVRDFATTALGSTDALLEAFTHTRAQYDALDAVVRFAQEGTWAQLPGTDTGPRQARRTAILALQRLEGLGLRLDALVTALVARGVALPDEAIEAPDPAAQAVRYAAERVASLTRVRGVLDDLTAHAVPGDCTPGLLARLETAYQAEVESCEALRATVAAVGSPALALPRPRLR